MRTRSALQFRWLFPALTFCPSYRSGPCVMRLCVTIRTIWPAGLCCIIARILSTISRLFTSRLGDRCRDITPELLAVALQHILPIEIVGRCILSLCIVSVAFAGFLFLRKACSENSSLALVGILVAFNPMFLLGSISYQMSIAFCLLAVSLWMGYCSSRRVSTALWVLLVLFLTYLTHLGGILVAGLVMGVYALYQQSRWKTLGVLAVLSLPTLAVMGYNLRHGGGAAAGHFVFADIAGWDKFRNLVFPVRLFTSRMLDAVVLAALAILVVLLFRAQQRIRIQPIWIAACLSLSYSI